MLPVQPALLPDHPRRALRRQVRQTLPSLIRTLHRMDRRHLVSTRLIYFTMYVYMGFNILHDILQYAQLIQLLRK